MVDLIILPTHFETHLFKFQATIDSFIVQIQQTQNSTALSRKGFNQGHSSYTYL